MVYHAFHARTPSNRFPASVLNVFRVIRLFSFTSFSFPGPHGFTIRADVWLNSFFAAFILNIHAFQETGKAGTWSVWIRGAHIFNFNIFFFFAVFLNFEQIIRQHGSIVSHTFFIKKFDEYFPVSVDFTSSCICFYVNRPLSIGVCCSRCHSLHESRSSTCLGRSL